jgi:hypothetical protein
MVLCGGSFWFLGLVELLSHQIGVVVGSAIIFTIARLCIRWFGPGSYRPQLQVCALWVLLTLIFEFTLGYFFGYSLERILSDYNIAKGGVMVFGMLFMLFAPALAAKARHLNENAWIKVHEKKFYEQRCIGSIGFSQKPVVYRKDAGFMH